MLSSFGLVLHLNYLHNKSVSAFTSLTVIPHTIKIRTPYISSTDKLSTGQHSQARCIWCVTLSSSILATFLFNSCQRFSAIFANFFFGNYCKLFSAALAIFFLCNLCKHFYVILVNISHQFLPTCLFNSFQLFSTIFINFSLQSVSTFPCCLCQFFSAILVNTSLQHLSTNNCISANFSLKSLSTFL